MNLLSNPALWFFVGLGAFVLFVFIILGKILIELLAEELERDEPSQDYTQWYIDPEPDKPFTKE